MAEIEPPVPYLSDEDLYLLEQDQKGKLDTYELLATKEGEEALDRIERFVEDVKEASMNEVSSGSVTAYYWDIEYKDGSVGSRCQLQFSRSAITFDVVFSRRDIEEITRLVNIKNGTVMKIIVGTPEIEISHNLLGAQYAPLTLYSPESMFRYSTFNGHLARVILMWLRHFESYREPTSRLP